MELAERYKLLVVEDAAQAIDSYYKGRPLGSIGHMAVFSFHETKNVISGEGGMLAINNERLSKRAEIIWEKGTNRSKFFRGEVNKYGWVDTGSSFLPSEVISAFLYAQQENLDDIQQKRKGIWERYHTALSPILAEGKIAQLPSIPDFATNNAHMYYVVCDSLEQRSALSEHLKAQGIFAVYHYLSLHKSDYYAEKHRGGELPESDCLVRLPLFYELNDEQQCCVVRGKANKTIEIGAKFDASVDEDNFTRLEYYSFDAYNESTKLQTIIEAYYQRRGHYPLRVLVDQISPTRANRAYCKERGIHLSARALGGPQQDEIQVKSQKKQYYLDQCERVEVERAFSQLKRKCGIGLITRKLKQTTLHTIALSIFVQNLKKILCALIEWATNRTLFASLMRNRHAVALTQLCMLIS